jgi:Protein of unknown function (DUF3301)
MFEFILLALLLAAAWFWLDSIAKREVAVNIGRNLAGRWQLQLLDETVSCTKIRLGRDSRGHAQLQRLYEFEVSASGAERMRCNLQLLGKQLQTWHIPPYVQPNVQPNVQSDSVESNVHRIH